MSERSRLKVFPLQDDSLRKVVEETFTPAYRHGYWLREIVRSERNGQWLCVWERTLDSFAADFDWRPADEGS